MHRVWNGAFNRIRTKIAIFISSLDSKNPKTFSSICWSTVEGIIRTLCPKPKMKLLKHDIQPYLPEN